MRRFHILSVAISFVLLFAISACANSPAPAPTSVPAPAAVPTAETAMVEKPLEDFNAGNFGNSTNIDNPWMPFKPGMRYVYEGTTVEDDGTLLPHRIVINVTDLTKEIGGVRSLVTWDLDYSDDELVEAELAFLAQDKEGTVWRMGEYPEAYADGKIIEAPTWLHGFDEAHAGVMMWANPKLGTPSYAQGWGPAVGWTDRGKVDQMNQKTCVLLDCYEGVLVIAETSQAEGPDAQQLKYFARGVGNIRVGWRGVAEKTKETLELVRIETLNSDELAQVRAKAFELEKSAYEQSPDVYGQTAPMEQLQAEN